MALTVSALVLTNTPAYAEPSCPSGLCEAEINCTTGVVTYRDARPRVTTIEPPQITGITPTHEVVIQTANRSFSTSGSLEQVEQAVQKIISEPQIPQNDPCLLGGCNKVIINATTGVVDVLPLSEIDIAQRQIDQQKHYAFQLEMAQAAKEAIVKPIISSTAQITDYAITQETTTVTTTSSTNNSVMVQEWVIEVKRLINQLLALIARLNK